MWKSSSCSPPASSFLGRSTFRETRKTRNDTMKMVKISSDFIPRPQRHSFGRLTSVSCVLLAIWLFLLRGTPFGRPSRDHQPEYVPSIPPQPTLDPVQSNHRTEVVQWDQHSLIIHGQRVLLWYVPECVVFTSAGNTRTRSGEVHPWRLPVPSLWRDVLEKIKAAGMNGISVYSHWCVLRTAKDVVSNYISGVYIILPLIPSSSKDFLIGNLSWIFVKTLVCG